MVWLDAYERRARVVPGLWLIGPVVVAIVAFGLRANPAVSSLLGLVGAAGGPVVLAEYVRGRGLKAEDRLLQEWGGWPTTLLLTKDNDAATKQRRKDVETATGRRLPAVSAKDQSGVGSAVSALRQKTKNHKQYPLIFSENCNYGYERNLLGARPVGLAISSIALAASIVTAVAVATHRHKFGIDLGAGVAAELALLLFWILIPSKDRTRRIAVKYADALLSAAHDITAA